MKSCLTLFIILVSLGCQPRLADTIQQTTETTPATIPEQSVTDEDALLEADKLNVLWIVAEDLSEYLPMFGDPTITTPNLSRLASEGVCYDQFFTPAAVCAPARSGIALGMYPTHLGSNHMRTGPWFNSSISQERIDGYSKKDLPEGVNSYEAIAPEGARMMSEYLRMAGYYCTNNSKEDYQFVKTVTAWDECGTKAHWRNRKDSSQPFFSIFNLTVTHESQIWARAKDSLWVDADLEVTVPPYLPDTKVGRQDMRQMYSNIKQMDAQVGELLAELEEDGLLEKTIIFWYSDHGGPLPRQKRLLYDSGIKVPMIIRFPHEERKMTRNDDLVSFIDLAPTVLSLAGITPPPHMDGKAFLGTFKRWTPAQYVFAAGDRFDEQYDQNRAVRDKRYKLIQYLMPEKSMFLHVNYRDQMPIMQELHRLRKAGELTPTQALWFRETKPEFEFFDTQTDPHEINNLIDDPAYVDQVAELKQALNRWYKEVPDQMRQDERDYLATLWPGGVQPVVAEPVITISGDKIVLKNSGAWASIGYQFVVSGEQASADQWEVYTKPIKKIEGKTIHVIADRVGYKPSGLVSLEL